MKNLKRVLLALVFCSVFLVSCTPEKESFEERNEKFKINTVDPCELDPDGCNEDPDIDPENIG